MNRLCIRITAIFISIVTFFSNIFGLPLPQDTTKQIDLSNYVLTFSDEFDGELDRSVWSGHYTYGNTSSVRRGGYWNNDVPYTKDGKLYIPLFYSETGMGNTGAGWYSAGIDTDNDCPNGFSQTYGYFECRCIVPESEDSWGAFWLYSGNVGNVDGSGKDGTEIDIMESECENGLIKKAVGINLHYDGYGEAHMHDGVDARVKNPYGEFNTYAVEWNEDEYNFYINGNFVWSTDFGGVCETPLYLILSQEISGDSGIPDKRDNADGEATELIVDYVRVYQRKDRIK